MKKIYSRLSIILTLCLMSVLVSCEKDKEMTFTNVTINDEQVIAAYDIAVIEATISSEATIRNAFVQYATTEDFEEYNEVAMLEDKSRYIAILTDLQDNTTYYYRYMVSNRFSAIVLENIHQLTTLQATVPSVKLDTILSVGDTYAQVQVTLACGGGAEVTEIGVCWSTNPEPKPENNAIQTTDSMSILTLDSLQPNTRYSVRAYARNKRGIGYSEEKTFTTTQHSSTPEYVDLGLSVKWATMNVGAKTPEDYGDYFAWGETEPKDVYDWSTYKWCNGSETSLTKYNNSGNYGTVDDNIVLEPEDDVSTVNWGGEWRIPTDAELNELVNECTWIWLTQNGINGYKVIGSNGNSIFLPAAGFRSDSDEISSETGNNGVYASRTLVSLGPSYIMYLFFDNENKGWSTMHRYVGYSIRPVYGVKAENSLASVTTSAVTQITETTAVAGGNVTAEGGSVVLERGVVYSTSQNPTTDDKKVTNDYGLGEFTCNLTSLQAGTTYYVRAYAVNNKGTAYGEEVSFSTGGGPYIPNYVAKPFSISSSQKVFISPGNLQYHPVNDEWRFAESQLDYIGEANDNISFTYNGWIDLFGWSTDGNNATQWGISTSTDYKEYSGNFVDWGTNKIGNDAPNTWRTLNYEEWQYLLNERTNATALYGVAQVLGVNGLILLPDDWVCPDGISFKPGCYSDPNSSKAEYYAAHQIFNLTQWSIFEQKGAIFFPAAGDRWNNTRNLQRKGAYWYYSQSNYRYLLILSNLVSNGATVSSNGMSVRLARPVSNADNLIPTLTTTLPTQVANTSAVVGGNVISEGSASVIERGVVYATTQSPTTANNKVSGGAGTGLFTCNLTDLQPNTQYYVRAYAVNSKGTAYGEEVSFSTEEEVVAIPEYVDLGLSVKWATFNVGATKPEEFGDYFAWGESEPKEKYDWSTYKWCNGTDANMTKYNATDGKIILELEDDAAYMNWGGNWRIPTMDEMNELSYQCTWTVINKNGVNGYKVTSKSNSNSIFIPFAGYYNGSLFTDVDVNGYYWSSVLQSNGHPNFAWRVCMKGFTTNTCNKCLGHSIRPVYGEYITYNTPTITTNIPTQITSTTAVAGGNVTSDGNASVTERGVVYATTQNPTTADNKVSNGSGMGTFTCNLIDLQPNTSYYIRAYAINEKGTAYGEEVTFTTNKQIVLPSVTTAAITQITETTAVAGGNVTSDGGASVTERGVMYATTQNPTTNNTKVTSGTGIGSFTCNLTDLQPNTTYYVRAYAINEKGTVYGEELSFTTDEPVNIPSNGIENGYEWVDLGLSVKWATCNVGASKPEEYGDYYKWSTSLFSSDIANITLGGKWRTPTNRELNELINNSIWTWNSTSKGYIVTSKKNDNTIFLPAAGFDEGEKGKNGYYWTSTIHETLNQNAYVLYFNTSNIDIMYLSYNYYYSIRPVCP